MLKQKRQIFEVFFVAADVLVVSAAWLVAYWIRFESGFVPVDKGVPSFDHYLSMLLFIWLIWAFVYRKMGLYRPMRGVRRIKEVWLLINANAFATVLLIAVTYLFREKSIPFSRLVFFYFVVTSTVFSVVLRWILRSLLREVRRRGHNLRYMLVVGAGKVAGDIASRVRLHRELGIQLIGCLSEEGESPQGPKGIPIIGSYADLKRIVDEIELDQVVVALPLEDSKYLPGVMEAIGDSLIDVKVVPDIYQFVSLGGSIEEFEGLPVISLRDSPLEGAGLVMKRSMDFMMALILLVVFTPLMLVIALLVKLSSRGPVFYQQDRVSYDGTTFPIYKFRTMSIDAEEKGPGWTKPDDCRVTGLGKFLRASSLDELPQLFNVIRGDMSIVGPRPERPVFIKEFRKRIPRYMLRHKVPAGITGWAQVNGWRGDTSIDKRIEHDLYYIEHWSLALDIKILFLTLLRGFRNRNAY